MDTYVATSESKPSHVWYECDIVEVAYHHLPPPPIPTPLVLSNYKRLQSYSVDDITVKHNHKIGDL